MWKTKEKIRTTLLALDPTTFDPPFSSTQANADENAPLRSESIKPSAPPGQTTPVEISKSDGPVQPSPLSHNEVVERRLPSDTII